MTDNQTKKAKYIGKPKTRQFQGAWIEPDQIIESSPSIIDSLLELSDFTTAGSDKQKKEKPPAIDLDQFAASNDQED